MIGFNQYLSSQDAEDLRAYVALCAQLLQQLERTNKR